MSANLTIIAWRWDCGRMGDLECLMTVDRKGQDLIDKLIADKTEIYFGEVLGKHSEIRGTLNADEFAPRAAGDDAETIDRVLSGGKPFPDCGWRTLTGDNPLDYLEAM